MTLGRAVAQDNPPPLPADEQPQVLASGPVNEAFCRPINMDDQGGVIAPPPTGTHRRGALRRQAGR